MKRFSVHYSLVFSIRRKVQERGYSTTELGMEDCATCGREAVKSVLRLFDELVKCAALE